MATITLSPILEHNPINLQRKRWTVTDCYDLIEMGKLQEGRFELIEGDIIPKMPAKEEHVYGVSCAKSWAERVFGEEYVRTQFPLHLDALNEPEPDVAVMHHTRRYYLMHGTPEASEARLVVEISHTTLREDMSIKASLYARAGIAEYWVVDIIGRRVIVHRDPKTIAEEASYETITAHDDTATISPLANPQSSVNVSDLLP
jgi:Uma2 family endonuclease